MMKKIMKRFSENEKGQSFVEFALILPILIMLLTVPVDFYRYANAKMLLNSAASDMLSQMEYGVGSVGPDYTDWANGQKNVSCSRSLDTSKVNIVKACLIDSPMIKNYDYYVYASDKDDKSNTSQKYTDKFDKHTTGQVLTRNAHLQLSYEFKPITMWGQAIWGSDFFPTGGSTIYSETYERTLYCGGN